MTQVEIIKRIKEDLNNKKIWIESDDMYRYYTDGKRKVMMGDIPLTCQEYYNTFINVQSQQTNPFDDLTRCTIYVGPPDTGKTYSACKFCEDNNIPYLLVMGRDDLTLETLLEDFVLVDGKPGYTESLALKMLSGKDKGIIIIDEFNTLRTGVMKTLQPLLDNTSKTFEFKGKIYNKNLNCKFIFTLNDKDKGISILPDAILSRSMFKYFGNTSNDTLQNWTGYKKEFIDAVYEMYQLLNITQIFGSRQLNIIHSLKDADDILGHLQGILNLRNEDSKLLNTPEIKSRVQSIISKGTI